MTEKQDRLPYSPPTLKVRGDIRDLTQRSREADWSLDYKSHDGLS